MQVIRDSTAKVSVIMDEESERGLLPYLEAVLNAPGLIEKLQSLKDGLEAVG